MNRREMLGLVGAAPFGLAAVAAQDAARSAQAPDAPRNPGDQRGRAMETIRSFGLHSLTDVNVSLFRWPLRRVRFDDTAALVEKLRGQGVLSAWAGSFEGLLNRDIAGVNERLASECMTLGAGTLIPFGSINPMLPDWEDDIRRCAEVHKMPGVRLHPNYHGYAFDAPEFERLLQLATERKIIVQIALHLEDERMMNPRLRVPPVQLDPLAGVLARVPGARIVLLNALNTALGPSLLNCLAAGRVHVEISTLEGVGGLGRLLSQVPLDRVLFGSHAPLFYHEAAVLKLKETPLTDDQLIAIRRTSADKLLTAAKRA